MIGKILVRTAVAAGIAAATVQLVRKYDLVNKAGDAAQAFVAKGIGLTSQLLDQFGPAPAAAPTEDDSPTDPLAEFQAAAAGRGVSHGNVDDETWRRATRGDAS